MRKSKEGEILIKAVVNLKVIKRKRIEKMYTVSEMAELLDLRSPDKYFRRESGEYNFQVNELPALSKALGMPIENFFVTDLRKSKNKEVVK